MVIKGVGSREYVYGDVKISDVELWTRERQSAHECRVGTWKNYRGLVGQRNDDSGAYWLGFSLPPYPPAATAPSVLCSIVARDYPNTLALPPNL